MLTISTIAFRLSEQELLEDIRDLTFQSVRSSLPNSLKSVPR